MRLTLNFSKIKKRGYIPLIYKKFKNPFLAAWRSIFTENLKTRLRSFRTKISQTTTFRRSIRPSLKIPAPPRASSATIRPTKTTTWSQLKKIAAFILARFFFHSSILYSVQKNYTLHSKKTAEKNRNFQKRSNSSIFNFALKNYF